jgi:microcystin-dependent protein
MGSITTFPQQAPVIPVTGTTLAYAQTTTSQTGITTADLTGLSVTVTVPEGRRIRITGYSPQFSRTAGTVSYVNFEIWQDGVQAGLRTISINNNYGGGFVSTVLTPSAGIHTYKLRAGTDGTVSLVPTANYPAYILVEDITQQPWPYPPASVPVGLLGQAVVTALANGAPTQYIGATETALPNYSVNVTVPAGRVLRIMASGDVFGNAAGGIAGFFRLKRGSTEIDNYQTNNNLSTTVSEGWEMLATDSPPAGTHTYTVALQRNVGAADVVARVGGSDPGRLIVEDITPTPTPANSAPSSTLGYAEITSSSTSAAAASTVDIPGLSVTVTVPAGRRLRITAKFIGYANTLPARIASTIREGSTVLGNFEAQPTQAGMGVGLHAVAVVSPSAGTHTYKVSITAATNTGFVYVDATGLPGWILVEDITAASVPGSPSFAPVGSVMQFAGAAAPSYWLLCDGAAISRTAYPDLFTIIGTTYGAGDGSTTFNLPNLKGRVPVGRDAAQTEFDVLGETGGEKAHVLTIAELAAHNHSYSNAWTNAPGDGGSDINRYHVAVGIANDHGLGTANNGSGTAHNNLQPYIALNYIIRAVA